MVAGPKEAVALAKYYAVSVFPDSVLTLRLEEIELTGDVWHVTLSWTDPDGSIVGALAGILNPKLPRLYKVFEIDKSTSEVTAMRIRKFE